MPRARSTPEPARSNAHLIVNAAPSFIVSAVELFERPVELRLPFRFGAATVREAMQAFVRVRIRLADGHESEGVAAEMMMPKWFDKSPAKSNEDNVDDLRRALSFAATAYLSASRARTAFGHAAAHYADLMQQGVRQDMNALTVSYGAALLDRALLDALCGASACSFAAAMRANLGGIDASLTPDLQKMDLDAFLATLPGRWQIAARHTVGILDPLTSHDPCECPADGLPATLTDVIARYGHRHFKLKLGGDARADVERLGRIGTVLDALPDTVITLDGNEQYAGPHAVEEFWQRLAAEPRAARLMAAVAYLEQPLPRAIALDVDVRSLGHRSRLLIDESDGTLDAFPKARELGYSGRVEQELQGRLQVAPERGPLCAMERG